MSNVWILSFKYAPGLMKEMLCLEDCFKNESFNVKLVLNPAYQALGLSSPELDSQRTTYLDSIYDGYNIAKQLISTQPKILFFYNSHPFNFLFMLLGLVFCRNSRRVLVLHEPNKKNVFKNFGFHGFVVHLITLFNKLQSWLCSDLAVLSPYGAKLLQESVGYNRFCRVHQARILLPSIVLGDKNEGTYISFVGNINSTKGVDWFLDLVEYASSVRSELKFAIVTGSNLSEKVVKRASEQRDTLTIFNPTTLKDCDISSWLRKSIAVFSLHKSVTQSGVFVECVRHGVPTIVLNEVGFTQFIKNCGTSVSGSSDPKELLSAIKYIMSEESGLKESINEVYDNNFNPSNFKLFYSDLIVYTKKNY